MPSSRKRVPKAVLDTNVWVSALIWGGRPSEVVHAAEDGMIKIFASKEIIEEISQVLEYPKIKRVYEAAGMRYEELIETIIGISKLVNASLKVTLIAEHPADDKFIECALAAGAGYIVSGDRHLLKKAGYEKIRIVPVGEFLGILKK